MSDHGQFAGIIPAVVTPLDEREQFAPDPFEELLSRLYAAGVHGIYVGGSTGEGLLLPVETRELLAEAAVRLSPPDKQVIVHVGAHRTADALRLARHAASIGARAISSLPPAGGLPFDDVHSYYRELASAVDLPLFLYYFPAFAPAVSTLEQVSALARIPGVAGVKFTDYNLYRLGMLCQSGLRVFNGHDEVLAPGLWMGAIGGIGSLYNLAPELALQIFDCACRGDWNAARVPQMRLNSLIEIVLRFPWLQALKQILEWSGIHCGPCAGPRRARLSIDEQQRLRAALTTAGLDEMVFKRWELA